MDIYWRTDGRKSQNAKLKKEKGWRREPPPPIAKEFLKWGWSLAWVAWSFTANLRTIPVGLLPSTKRQILAYFELFSSFITSKAGPNYVAQADLKPTGSCLNLLGSRDWKHVLLRASFPFAPTKDLWKSTLCSLHQKALFSTCHRRDYKASAGVLRRLKARGSVFLVLHDTLGPHQTPHCSFLESYKVPQLWGHQELIETSVPIQNSSRTNLIFPAQIINCSPQLTAAWGRKIMTNSPPLELGKRDSSQGKRHEEVWIG